MCDRISLQLNVDSKPQRIAMSRLGLAPRTYGPDNQSANRPATGELSGAEVSSRGT